MLTKKDLEQRSLVLLNTIENKNYKFVVKNHNLVIVDKETEKIILKLLKQKVFAVFIIGRMSISTVVMQKCAEFDIAICFMKTNFSCFAFLGEYANANFRLRQLQHKNENSFHLAQFIVKNKIQNQIKALNKIRNKNQKIKQDIFKIKSYKDEVNHCQNLSELMGYEGNAARLYFKNLFKEINWVSRKPQTKIDPLNTVLDIGYSFLFNYVECFLRLYGFDLYVGNLHQFWFKRKSLVCDLVEPIRPIIDLRIRKAFNRNEIQQDFFNKVKEQYVLKPDKTKIVCDILFESLIEKKDRIYDYIRQYYLCFMKQTPTKDFIQYHL